MWLNTNNFIGKNTYLEALLFFKVSYLVTYTSYYSVC
jgi:hypothetical protein